MLRLLVLALIVASPGTSSDGDADDAKKLSEKLRQKNAEKPTDDVMASIITDMGVAADRLSKDFDAGDETLAVQARIVEQLDRAIKASIRQGTPSDGSSKPRSDKRTKPQDGTRSRGTSQQQKGESSRRQGQTAIVDQPDADDPEAFRDRLRKWGNLPERDRDEVIQGVREESIPRFRKWVDRYYRALGEENVE